MLMKSQLRDKFNAIPTRLRVSIYLFRNCSQKVQNYDKMLRA